MAREPRRAPKTATGQDDRQPGKKRAGAQSRRTSAAKAAADGGQSEPAEKVNQQSQHAAVVESGPKSEEKGAEPPPRKQAVVVIHGMGEQRPMDTLRSFVESVWVQAPELTRKRDGTPASSADAEASDRRLDYSTEPKDEYRQPVSEDADQILVNKTWIVPDVRTGSFELGRITTPKGSTDIRTDFYEFYWADVMEGTTWQHLWGWVSGLLFRKFRDVPDDVRSAWVLMWTMATVAAGLFLLAAVPNLIPTILYDFFGRIYETRFGVALLLALVGIVVCALFIYSGRWSKLSILFPVATGVIFYILPVGVTGNPRVWIAAAAAGLTALLHNAIVPTFGDVARYVQAKPSTIEKRAAIRERGLTLLRCLQNSAEYERIVVVGHSLGSIVAYDLLQLAWLEFGPTKDNSPSKEALLALRETDKEVKEVSALRKPPPDEPFMPWEEGKLKTWQKKQSAVAAALAAENRNPEPGRKPTWKITDFVTLGSPLTHAEFLLGKNLDDFLELANRRQLSLSPPLPDEEHDSVLIGTVAKGKLPPGAHHAALFAATRWTNIYDKPSGILWGDVISGSVIPLFGPGIQEHKVRILRAKKWPRALSRFFTHTQYWTWRDWYVPDAPPFHIEVLRDALDLTQERWQARLAKETVRAA